MLKTLPFVVPKNAPKLTSFWSPKMLKNGVPRNVGAEPALRLPTTDSARKNTLTPSFSSEKKQICEIRNPTILGLALESMDSGIDFDAVFEFSSKIYSNPEIFIKIGADLRSSILAPCMNTGDPSF